MKIETIESIHRLGAGGNEDGIIDNYPFFGVVHGISPPFLPNEGPKLWEEKTYGSSMKWLVQDRFNILPAKESLENAFYKIIEVLRHVQSVSLCLNMDCSDELAHVSTAIMRINDKRIDIVNTGDCYAVWLKKSGEIGHTTNQARFHVKEQKKIIAELWQECGNQEILWKKFAPILKENRLKDINQKKSEKGYPMLNGQREVMDFKIQSVIENIEDIELIMAFSSGAVSRELQEKEDTTVATRMLKRYRRNGLKGIVKAVRDWERKKPLFYTKARELTVQIIKPT